MSQFLDDLGTIEMTVANSTYDGVAKAQHKFLAQTMLVIRDHVITLSSIEKPFQHWTAQEIVRAARSS
jgi:hypothetical protein